MSIKVQAPLAIVAGLLLFALAIPANAVGSSDVLQLDPKSSKFISAAVAFFAAAFGAGIAIARAGAAGLAAAAERPEIRTTAIIITALGEAIGIYGIVIAIIILGQPV